MAEPLSLGPGDPVRLGGYRIEGRLGTGGQGAVYLGRPQAGGEPVAIKLLHARLVADAQARARFVRELALLRRVAGFCTAQVLAADTAGDRPYIVSEYVPGPSLRDLVRRDGPRAGADLDRLAIGTVTALTAIHRAEIVHRDFKPHNVLVGPDGPRVIDFGIARALDSGATVTSQVVGTPAYMAPEQIRGAVIGPSADMFAWAATLLFAATGRDPFAGGRLPDVMHRVLTETPDVTVLPPRIAEVASRCLRKDAAERPTAEEALLWLLGRSQTRPQPSSAPLPTAPAPDPGPPATWADQPAPVDDQAVRRERDETTGRLDGPARTGGGIRRTPAVVVALVLATLLAVLDVVAMAVLIAQPSLSSGPDDRLLPVAAGSFIVLAVVTLVAVVFTWRGRRAAAWTLLAVRVLRMILWGAWSTVITVETPVFATHAALSAVVVLLLAHGLWSGGRAHRRRTGTVS